MLWNHPERATPAELLAAVRALPHWTAFEINAVSRALRIWCEQTLSQEPRKSIASASAIVDAIGRLQSAHSLDAIDALVPETNASWNTFEMLLNDRVRRAEAMGEAGATDALWKRKHVATVLQQLLTNSLKQSAVLEMTGLTESGVSYLIRTLENAGMIESERATGDARARVISITAAGRDFVKTKAKNLAKDAIQKAMARNTLTHAGIA